MSVALLPNQLSNTLLQVRFAWGADLTADPAGWVWTDVTSDVMQANGGGVTISPMGRSNESSTAQPAGCSFRLKNPTGAYTPYNPASTNYPNVRLGTPVQVRVSMSGGVSYFTRFQGEVSAWTPGWEVQGKSAYVTLTASGVTRRLGSGNKPLKSALYRAVTTASVLPSAYWSCEDGADGLALSSAISPIAGVSPMLAVGASNFASTPGAPGSDVQPDFSAGGSLVGNVPGTGTPTSWRIQCLARANTISSPDFAVPLSWDTADGNGWELDLNALTDGGLLYSDTLGNTFTSGAKVDDGQWHELQVTATQSGGNIVINVSVDGTLVINQTFAGTVSRITQVFANTDASTSSIISGVGHYIVWNGSTTVSGLDTVDAMRGHAGEIADVRITRLCTEEGTPLSTTGSSTTAMGPQGIDTFINLLRECEAADLGYLLDGLGPGLTYIARSSLYNQTAQVTINANSGQVPATPGPQPTNDDQRLVNRVTVTRTNGSFVVVEDEDGPLGTAAIGVFDSRFVVNTETDDQLLQIGNWLTGVGTVEGMRYPQIPIDIAAAPEQASSWVQAVPTDRIDLTNLSNRLTQHPAGDVSLLAEGWTEFLSARQWKATVSCSNYQPWLVAALSSTFRLGLAPGAYTLASSLTSGATSLSLATAAGNPLAETAAGSYPCDLDVAGWKVHVTACSGASSPQTLTISASPNTSTILSGTAVKVYRPARLAL